MNRSGPKMVALVVLGALAGVILWGFARLPFLPEEHGAHETHYHANWAVFVRGERMDLTAERYMEDVIRCKADPTRVDPEDRVHMHNGEHDVVHVHHDGVTWGHFFANLGFSVGERHLYTDTGDTFRSGDGETLKFVLNGQAVPSVTNLLMESEDRLLISYGPESLEEVLRTQLPRVASNAADYNGMPDPGSCGGAAPHEHRNPLVRAFWF